MLQVSIYVLKGAGVWSNRRGAQQCMLQFVVEVCLVRRGHVAEIELKVH
jgi:hypothetical protein